MKGLILEDVQSTAELIKESVSSFYKGEAELTISNDLDDAYSQINNNKFDVLFLDINLPRGTSFDLIKKLSLEGEIDSEIIFITGQQESEYVVNAIKFSAIDYLYKPIEEEQLKFALNKLQHKIALNERNKQIDLLLDLVSNNKEFNSPRIAFQSTKGKVVFLELDKITHLEADSTVTKIHLLDGTNQIAFKNLGYYKEFLVKEHAFIPISKSIIVNGNNIKEASNNGAEITLQNGKQIHPSRRGSRMFKEQYIKQKKTTNWLKKLFFALNKNR